MGSGSSRNKVEKFDKGIQASGTKPDRFTSPTSSSLFKQTSSKPVKQQVLTQDDTFQLDPNIEEYSSVWNPDTKVRSNCFQ
jgi:hypothetical protein